MLSRIDAEDQADALTLLRWLTFSYEPLTLEQLAEARVIDPADDPDSDGIVDIENKGDWQDTLDILAGLVVAMADRTGRSSHRDTSDTASRMGRFKRTVERGGRTVVVLPPYSPKSNVSEDDAAYTQPLYTPRYTRPRYTRARSDSDSGEHVAGVSGMAIDHVAPESPSGKLKHSGTAVRLAHFSIKEYLQSSRIKDSVARAYHLDPGREHRFLTQSCLTYLAYYSESPLKPSPRELRRPTTFLLTRYAAENWWKHAKEQMSGTPNREVRYLLNEKYVEDFLSWHSPSTWLPPWHARWADVESPGTNFGLLFASYHNLKEVVEALIAAGVQLDATHGAVGSALYAAAGRGHADVVCMLLDGKADPDMASPGCYSFAIQLAAAGGYDAVVRILLDKGADVNIKGGEEQTALQAAVRGGHEAVVRLLVDNGADVRLLEIEGEHALYHAADQGYEAILRLLLDAGAAIDYRWGFFGTALQAAARRGHTSIVRLLLNRKANVNLCGEDGLSALQYAAEEGHEAIVCLLLDAEADVTLQARYPNYPNTALQWAVNIGHETIVRLLLDANPIPKSMIGPHSAWDTHFEEASPGPRIDAAVDAGQALCIACKRGHEKLVSILLDAGANVNTLWGGNHAASALSRAVVGDHEGIMQILLNAAGVEVDARRRNGQTALHYASRLSNQQCVAALLDAGADPMLGDEDGYTPLVEALGNGRKNIAQIIWKAAPDASQEELFAGALIYASERHGDDVVRQLLNDELNVDEAMSRRQSWNAELFGSFERCLASAYLAAARRRLTDTMQILVDSGADPSVPDQDRRIAPFTSWKQYTSPS
jgi:ankyrin repeat protein